MLSVTLVFRCRKVRGVNEIVHVSPFENRSSLLYRWYSAFALWYYDLGLGLVFWLCWHYCCINRPLWVNAVASSASRPTPAFLVRSSCESTRVWAPPTARCFRLLGSQEPARRAPIDHPASGYDDRRPPTTPWLCVDATCPPSSLPQLIHTTAVTCNTHLYFAII